MSDTKKTNGTRSPSALRRLADDATQAAADATRALLDERAMREIDAQAHAREMAEARATIDAQAGAIRKMVAERDAERARVEAERAADFDAHVAKYQRLRARFDAQIVLMHELLAIIEGEDDADGEDEATS